MLIFLLLKGKKKKVAFLQYCIRNTNILFKFPHKQPSLQLPSPKPSKMNHKNTWLVKRQKQNVKFWKTDYSLLLLLRNKQSLILNFSKILLSYHFKDFVFLKCTNPETCYLLAQEVYNGCRIQVEKENIHQTQILF